MRTVHGTAVARDGRGVLILGASGAGKSGLALALMALGADLVADDAVQISVQGGEVALSCPAAIRGMIEARGVGLLTVNFVDKAKLAFMVNLDETAEKRLPAPRVAPYFGVDVPLISGKNTPALASVLWCLLGGGQLMPTE